MICLEVKTPIWANADKTMIDCMVTFDSIGEVPFTASKQDFQYSLDIFNRCTSGEFGPIAEYIEPPPPPPRVKPA
jgi:hypothetical protein